MKTISIILFFLFSVGIAGKITFTTLLKKIKSPVELSGSSAELDDESKGIDDDKSNEQDSKEEGENKDTFILNTVVHPVVFFTSCANNHVLSFYNTLFKSHFKEVVTPPPELI
jgi:hypothetical protein